MAESRVTGRRWILRGWRWILASVVLVFFEVVDAEKDSNPYPWGDNPNNHAFRMYWNDARNVLQDLDKFQSLYIKYHGCVWSECSRGDSFDDDGENRDGDEYWYQYRTQPFCGNAAFSLYGILKNHFWQIDHCSRATYINSFFTYGGADTLLEALNVHVSTVFDDQNGNNNNNNYNNNYEKHSNSVCYAVEDEQRNRELNSQDNNNNNNNDGTSSTVGCSASGDFVVALFEGSTCDGNYYLGTSESSSSDMSKYNRKMNGVRCRQIWNRFTHSSGAGTYNRQRRRRQEMRQLEDQNQDDDTADGYYGVTYNSPAEYLLSHSWACDVSLYPNGLCPDPYGLKNKYDAVLQAVASGRPAKLAVWQVRLHTPMVFLSTLLFLAACVLLGLSYYVSRRDDAKKLGTWRPIVGRDLSHFFRSTVPRAFRQFGRMIRHGCRACLRLMPFEMRRRKNNDEDGDDPSRVTEQDRRSSSRRKHRSSKSNATTTTDDELDEKKRRHSSRRRGGGKGSTDEEMAARRPSSSRRRGEHDESLKGERPSSRRRREEEQTRSSKRSLRSSRRAGKQQELTDDDDEGDDGNLSPTSTSQKKSRRRDRRAAAVDPPDDGVAAAGDGNITTPYVSYFDA